VLLPAWCLLRRADAVVVIGAALEAAAAGDGHRKTGDQGRSAGTRHEALIFGDPGTSAGRVCAAQVI
jgi:hypothetical protein